MRNVLLAVLLLVTATSYAADGDDVTTAPEAQYDHTAASVGSDGLYYKEFDWTKFPQEEEDQTVVSVMVGGWSHHFDQESQNETHSALLIRYNHFVAGVYKNSYGRQSEVFGIHLTEIEADDKSWQINFVAGGVSGYRNSEAPELEGDNGRANSQWQPFLSPTFQYNFTSHFALEIGVLPMATGAGVRYTF